MLPLLARMLRSLLTSSSSSSISISRILLTIMLFVACTIRNDASLSLLTPGLSSNSNSNSNNQGSIQYDYSNDVTRVGGLLSIEEVELRLGQGNIKLGSILEYISGSTRWGFHGTNDRVGLTMNDNMIFQIINDGITVFQLKGDANFNDIILNEKDSKDIQHSLCILTIMINNNDINEHTADRKCSEKTDVHLSLTKMLRMLGSIQLKTIQMMSDVKVIDTTNTITNNIVNNGDIINEVNKAVTQLAEHFKLDKDIINNIIETTDRTSKSLTILQNDYVENSEKLKKVIIDMNDGFSRDNKNIDDINHIIDNDIKGTIVQKFDIALHDIDQKLAMFSNETVENVLGLVRQLNMLNSTMISNNDTSMLLYHDIFISLETNTKTINELANSTKIAMIKSDETNAGNLIALTNHFEDEINHVHARTASIADNCSHNTIMISQYADYFNITFLKLENSITRNMTSLENDMIDSLSGLASNVSAVIATTNSIFAKGTAIILLILLLVLLLLLLLLLLLPLLLLPLLLLILLLL